MSSLNSLVLTHALKKLTGVFMDFLLAKQAKVKGVIGEVSPLGARERRSAAKVPKWLAHLAGSTPFQVTEMLLEQMGKAEKSNDHSRLEAQTALLEVLVQEGLAMDIVSYSSRMT